MNPTLAGFILFVRNVMGISIEILPDNSPVLALVYNYAINMVLPQLKCLPNADPTEPSLYTMAVYNLAGATIIALAPDNPNLAPPNNTYFADLREKFGLNSVLTGLVQAASDQGTSSSMQLPDFVKGLLPGDLQLLKTPWGAFYESIIMNYGSIWGLT